MTRDEQIADLYHQGKSQRTIGRLLGISQPAVRKHLLKQGLIAPKTWGDNHITPSSDNPCEFQPVETFRDNPEPSDNCLHATQVHELKQQHQKASKDDDNPPRAAIPQGAASREWCHEWFLPKRRGQRFCCNACGARADGSTPLLEHSESCMMLKKSWGNSDNR